METNQVVKDVAEIVKKYLDIENVSFDTIISETRQEPPTFARQIIQKILHDVFRWSHSRIGRETGNRSHGAVLNSYRAIQNRIDTDKLFSKQYDSILESCKKLKNENDKRVLAFSFNDLISCMDTARVFDHLTNKEIIKANFDIEL